MCRREPNDLQAKFSGENHLKQTEKRRTISSSSFSLEDVFILEAPDTMSSKTLLRISSICALSNGSGVELSAATIFSASSSGGMGVSEPAAIPCMMSERASTGPSRTMTRRGDGPNTTKAIQRVLACHVSLGCWITGTEHVSLFGILA